MLSIKFSLDLNSDKHQLPLNQVDVGFTNICQSKKLDQRISNKKNG